MQGKPRQLNKGQLETLDLLFKFRFGTSELIAKNQNRQNGTAIRSRLTILRERGLIGRHYKPTDKLEGRHAAYYLYPDGLREIIKQEIRTDIPESVIKSIYKNRNVSRDFIDHCLLVFKVGTQLKAIYGDTIKTFTKSELASYEYFPKPLPDCFISIKENDDTKRFFLKVIDSGTPSFVINRLLKQYAKYYEDGDWDVTNSEFPTILFVCQTAAQEKKLLKRKGMVGEELNIYTTTMSALEATASKNDKIWSDQLEELKKSLKEL